MQLKDYVSISISLIALIFSFGSLLLTTLNFRRNATRLKIQQLNFVPSPLGIRIRPNILYLDRQQSQDLWTVVPMLHLILYIKIDNLSHTGITISNLIINDNFLVSKINADELKEELSLVYFASEKANNQELMMYGNSVAMSANVLRRDDYQILNIGDRIESKSSLEGIFIVSGNWNLYEAVKDGMNSLTIVTPDKKFDASINIIKTVIPPSGKKMKNSARYKHNTSKETVY